MMATDVFWMPELSLKPGHEPEFTALMTEMVAATSANEAGALSYEWSLSADGATCHIFERYADSAAVMTHPGAFAEKFAQVIPGYAQRLSTLVFFYLEPTAH